MTVSTPAAPPEQAAGGLGVASALAAPPFTRRALTLGLLAVLAIGVLDFASGSRVLLVAALVLPPLVVALAGRRGDAAAVALASTVVAALSVIWNGSAPAGETVVPVIVVLGGGLAAVAVALVRTSAAIALERFRLLYGVAAIADAHTATPETLVRALLDLLVPVLGDIASVDAVLGGESRRLGVRCSPAVPEPVAAAVARRRTLPDDDPRSTRRAALQDRSVMLRPSDVDEELLSALAGEPGDERLLAQLRITSGMNLPLRGRGRTFGTLSLGLGPSGRRYSDADLAFGEVLAGRVALALDNAGLTRELSTAEGQLGAVLGTLAEAVTVMDRTGRTVYANDAAVALLRVSSLDEMLEAEPGELMSRFAVFDEAGRRIDLKELPSARLLAGEEHVEPMLVRNVVVATGEDRWLRAKTSSLR
ncbi:MAG: hypothetical protein QOE28_891, partial [Solirubrobacteraceae bacterium]|nr:hypothetical protein [Solirubrobacteraceae bacterium]